MANPMNLANRTAVITGAAGGIGRGIALSLAQRKCHLILADINESGLIQTADMVSKHGVKVMCQTLDVSDKAAIAEFPNLVRTAQPHIDLLINNAGVAAGGTFDQISESNFEWLFEINFWGVVRMTRAFLPLLRASDDARIVNLSSVFGLFGPPGQTAYAASKFAVRGFSESLRHELIGTNIGVSVVHPGGVATNIADAARIPDGVNPLEAKAQLEKFKKTLKLPPETAGEIIVKGVEQRRDRILVGSDASAIAAIVRLFPVSYWKIMARLFGKALE